MTASLLIYSPLSLPLIDISKKVKTSSLAFYSTTFLYSFVINYGIVQLIVDIVRCRHQISSPLLGYVSSIVYILSLFSPFALDSANITVTLLLIIYTTFTEVFYIDCMKLLLNWIRDFIYRKERFSISA